MEKRNEGVEVSLTLGGRLSLLMRTRAGAASLTLTFSGSSAEVESGTSCRHGSPSTRRWVSPPPAFLGVMIFHALPEHTGHKCA